MTEQTEERKVGVMLGLGIFLMPLVFAWFTMRKGHTSKARVISLVWLGLTLLPVFASQADKDNSDEHQTVQAAQNVESTPRPKPAPRPKVIKAPEKVYRMNEPFQLGSFEYEIKEMKGTDKIGKRFTKETASDGAIFVLVEWSIENIGKETERVMSSDFKIKDSQGRTFDSSSRGTMALSQMYKNHDWLLSELQPGIKKQMVTLFEVPKSALDAPFKLVIPEKGLFNTGKVEILIGVEK